MVSLGAEHCFFPAFFFIDLMSFVFTIEDHFSLATKESKKLAPLVARSKMEFLILKRAVEVNHKEHKERSAAKPQPKKM